MSENAAASAAVSSVVEGLLAREEEDERREESLQNTATRLAEDLAQVKLTNNPKNTINSVPLSNQVFIALQFFQRPVAGYQQPSDRNGWRGRPQRRRSPVQLCWICRRAALVLAGAPTHVAGGNPCISFLVLC